MELQLMMFKVLQPFVRNSILPKVLEKYIQKYKQTPEKCTMLLNMRTADDGFSIYWLIVGQHALFSTNKLPICFLLIFACQSSRILKPIFHCDTKFSRSGPGLV